MTRRKISENASVVSARYAPRNRSVMRPSPNPTAAETSAAAGTPIQGPSPAW